MSNIHTHTLADVKAKYGEKVIETGTSFIINAYGKYQPNISFVLAKDYAKVGTPLLGLSLLATLALCWFFYLR